MKRTKAEWKALRKALDENRIAQEKASRARYTENEINKMGENFLRDLSAQGRTKSYIPW